MIEIVNGLSADDQVVNDYTVTLTDGMAAMPLPIVPIDVEPGDDTADSATINAGASAVTEGE